MTEKIDPAATLEQMILAAGRLESLGQVPGLDYRVRSGNGSSPSAHAVCLDGFSSPLAPSLFLRVDRWTRRITLETHLPAGAGAVRQAGRVVGLSGGREMNLQAPGIIVLDPGMEPGEAAGALRLHMIAAAAFTAHRTDTHPRHASDALGVLAHLAGIEPEKVRVSLDVDHAGHRWTIHLPGGDLG